MTLSCAVAALLSLAGCSDDSYGDRIPLVGTVTKGGQPLDVNATIYFEPVKGVDGLGSSGEVSGSKFSIPVESGPTPGKSYKVTVITVPGIPAEGTPRDQMRLSERFETTLEIPAREEENQELIIDFK
ncbi:MAG: hypothetical protein AB7U20_17785 [Planctomycetaceae bacterium]